MKKIDDKDIPNHFWSKVNILGEDDCWEWLGGTYSTGYGRFMLYRKAIPAHRMSWILTYGSIDNSLEACHKCDNKICVNPRHIFMGTHKENMDDAYVKGIIKDPPIRYGVDNTSSKLDENKVRETFYLFGRGWKKSEIARKFGVTKQAIGLVLSRKNWNWVEI